MGAFLRGLFLLWGATWLLNFLLGAQREESQPRRPPVIASPEAGREPRLAPRRGMRLPPPSPDDPMVMVEPERRQGVSVGTAFAVHEAGVWLTARHVVNDCRRIALRGRSGWQASEVAWMHPRADMAIVRSDGAPAHLVLSGEDARYDQNGYAVGYPQARPGAVHGHLLGRSRMRSSGLFSGEAATLAWAEVDRQPAVSGSLGGISGGPLLDDEGRVIGVIVAEVPRRGRFETVAPEVLRAVAARTELLPPSDKPPLTLPLQARDFGRVGEQLRRQQGVVLVGCSV